MVVAGLLAGSFSSGLRWLGEPEALPNQPNRREILREQRETLVGDMSSGRSRRCAPGTPRRDTVACSIMRAYRKVTG
jgi:hypothetical protein